MEQSIIIVSEAEITALDDKRMTILNIAQEGGYHVILYTPVWYYPNRNP